MVIDTSAVVAILFGAPDQRRYDEAIAAAPAGLVSAVTRVELAFVVEGRKREEGRELFERGRLRARARLPASLWQLPKAEIEGLGSTAGTNGGNGSELGVSWPNGQGACCPEQPLSRIRTSGAASPAGSDVRELSRGLAHLHDAQRLRLNCLRGHRRKGDPR